MTKSRDEFSPKTKNTFGRQPHQSRRLRLRPAERSSIDNGIWLCRTHAALIDRDEATGIDEDAAGGLACLSRETGIRVRDTDRPLAKLVGGVLAAAKAGSKDLAAAQIPTACYNEGDTKPLIFFVAHY